MRLHKSSTPTTPALMILGTHSNAGKSLLATAFCRILSRKGYRVAPFKAQNMSNNAGVTPEGGEMGRAQIVQAEAAGIEPHTDMNPVLLKPEAEHRSQIILHGQVYGVLDAENWFQTKRELWPEVQAAYRRLASHYDIIVLEGAGSPAEINLKAGDMVNLPMARFAGASALLVGDIDRGGVFAALAGTMLLLEPEERKFIKGFVINKFRGNASLLGNATETLKKKAFGVPTLGIIPFIPDLYIPDEDAAHFDNKPFSDTREQEHEIDIVIPRLPHISNFDEFDPLRMEPGIRVRFVHRKEEIGQPEAIILPGSKAVISDLIWLRQQGMDKAIIDAYVQGAHIVGICGGYQILGRKLVDSLGSEGEGAGEFVGLGLLPIQTVFQPTKQTQKSLMLLPNGLLVTGYEIHTGVTKRLEGHPFGTIIRRNAQTVHLPDGAQTDDGRVWGAYLHGIFENDDFRWQWLTSLGWNPSHHRSARAQRLASYDRLADIVEASVDIEAVLHMIGLK